MSNNNLPKDPLKIPKPPKPMTASILMAYLQKMADWAPIEDHSVMIGNKEVVNATIVDGKIILMTYLDYLNVHPPCKKHNPVRHRDAKPPWCEACKLTIDWKNPHG